MTLRDYLLLVARSWIVIAVTVAVGLVVAGLLAVTASTSYSASAQVLFTGYDPRGGQDQAFFGNYVQSRMPTYGTLADSTRLLESAVDAIGSGETAEELGSRTEIEVSVSETMATVTVVDSTASAAARSANAVAEAFIDDVGRLEPEHVPAARTGDDTDSTQATITGVITREAVAPASPIGQNVPLHLLAGALSGLAVSIGVVALREVLRREASSAGEDP
ncbi:MAG: YveK family protein [Aeromicrobium sp.]